MRTLITLTLLISFGGTCLAGPKAEAGAPKKTAAAKEAPSKKTGAPSTGKFLPPEPRKLETEEQKTLYALGVVIGHNLSTFDLTPPELVIVTMGLGDSLADQPIRVDMKTFRPKINKLQRTRSTAKIKKEEKRSAAFLLKTAKDKSMTRLLSGILYKELRPGIGESVKSTDIVLAHYLGTLVDGAEFDNSYKRNKPQRFNLNSNMIACWKEALPRMKLGTKARFVCPPSLAYGDVGFPPSIPGGAALIFDVELIDIVKK